MDLYKSYKRLFGPVITKYLYKLHNYIQYLDDGNTVFLYATRAGFRIKKLYEIFIDENLSNDKHKLFLTSRFLVSKSFLTSHKDIVLGTFINEYRYATVNTFIKGLLRQDPNEDVEKYLDSNYENINAVEFIENFDKSIHYDLYEYLIQENEKYDKYFKNLIGTKKRVVIIDSGWSGTIQKLLTKIYPELEFYGLYFGKIINKNPDWFVLQRIKGLMFEMFNDERFNKVNDLHLETAFNIHRHLIEDLFEPSFETVEYIDSEVPTNIKLEDQYDERFLGVLDYLKNSKNKANSILEIYTESDKAMRKLKDMILFPKSDAIKLFGDLSRSFDFGKEGSIKVLLEPKDRKLGDSKKQRIKDAIWSQGQIYLEYSNMSDSFIKNLQKNNLEILSFTFPKIPEDFENVGVAIITRTMNREILLRRAKNSIENQTYKDYMWVIINDGGDIEPVLKVVNESIVDPRRLVVINNFINIGMEAASNRAINTINSKYIVIHDDDDSWHPMFLETTTKFLESSEGKKYGGVITDTVYVSEAIENDKVKIYEKRPYNDWVLNVQISEMAQGNFFAPICFLFKRDIYNEIGGFDENLPVLGDWDFNLRFLMKTDIGVIKEPLAYYHHRDRDDGTKHSTYSNSVIGGISKHIEYASIVRNKFIRKYPEVFGNIISNGYIHQDIRHRLNVNENKQEELQRAIGWLRNEINEELKKSIGWLRNEIIKDL